MTTAERMHGITDRGKFEQLATAILRAADATYAAALHTGVNASGETVRSPVDGVCSVLRSAPPLMIFFAHTTTGKQGLKGKILTDDDSDFRKAVNNWNDLRAKIPNAALKLVVTSNERIGLPLYIEICAAASHAGIEIDVWDQGRLADFLDQTRAGHWLRQWYLGVRAELLSSDLLRNLCRQSIDAFKQETLGGAAVLTARELEARLPLIPVPGLLWVVGHSGFGKSVVVLREADRVLNSGGFAMFLPSHYLRRGTSLPGALDAYLRTLRSDLEPNAGAQALEISSAANPLLIIVEDINRTGDVDHIVNKLLALVAPQDGASGGKAPPTPSVAFRVPIWPEIWATNAKGWESKPNCDILEVGAFAQSEGTTAVRNALPTTAGAASDFEVAHAAEALGYDPFLTGIFASALRLAPQNDWKETARSAMDTFLSERLRKLAAANGRISEDYHTVITDIAEGMLRRRNLRPALSEVREWMQNRRDGWRILLELCTDGHLCRRGKSPDPERLVFRHDRLMEEFLSRAAGRLLTDFEANKEIIEDPFYVRYFGAAVADAGFGINQLETIAALAPGILFDAFRRIGEPATDPQRAVVQVCESWCRSYAATAPESLQFFIAVSLFNTNASAVRTIAELLPPGFVTAAAAFRNGSARAGARYLAHSVWGRLRAAGHDSSFERSVEHVRRRHSHAIFDELKALLQEDLSGRYLIAAIELAGYVQPPELDDLLLRLCEKYPANNEILAAMLWAALRCDLTEVAALLNPLMQRFSALPVEQAGSHTSLRHEIVRDLGFAARHGYTSGGIKYLVDCAERNETLAGDVLKILLNADNPDAAEFVVRISQPYPKRFTIVRPSISTGPHQYLQMSAETMSCLHQLWSPTNNDEGTRLLAFVLWLRGAQRDDAALVRSIPQDSILNEQAIQWRVKAGDISVVPHLLDLAKVDSFWWLLAPPVWCPAVREAVDQALAKVADRAQADFAKTEFEDEWHLPDLITAIPPSDAEAMLVKHWPRIGRRIRFIESAAAVCTAKCMSMVEASMSVCPSEVDVFEHFSLFLTGLRGHRITQEHFRSLEPYLSRMSVRTVEGIWHAALGQGMMDWADDRLGGRISKQLRDAWKTGDAGFVAELDELHASSRRLWALDAFCDRFLRGGMPRSRLLSLTSLWFRQHNDLVGLAITAQVVKHIGGRADLKILNHDGIEGHRDQISRIQADAGFYVRQRTLEP